LGGATSLVMTNLPELSVSLKLDTISPTSFYEILAVLGRGDA
jgi:hypothetical protein